MNKLEFKELINSIKDNVCKSISLQEVTLTKQQINSILSTLLDNNSVTYLNLSNNT